MRIQNNFQLKLQLLRCRNFFATDKSATDICPTDISATFNKVDICPTYN